MKKTSKHMKNKKTGTKTLVQKYFTSTLVVASCFLMVLAGPLGMSGNAYADRYQDQIDALQREIDGFQQQAADLSQKANTYENAVRALDAQQAAIQKRIDLNQARYDKLVTDIKKTEKDIADNQDVLGSTVADLYIDSGMTPIEMLASSKSIGDYVDKQEYRSAVRDQVESAITQIKKLKAELTDKKEKVGVVLADQKSQRDSLAAKKAEKNKLIAQTRGQEGRFRSLVEERRKERESVEAAQQAAYAAARSSWGGGYITRGSGGGGYPWAGAPYPCWNYGCIDDWGLFYRECVSYVAWKVDNTGHMVKGFNGQGNANQWPSATASYTRQGGTPHRGDAAIDPYIGSVGHAMYVEGVNGDGSINISEYNFAGPGQYSERRIPRSQYSGWVFITFPGR
jgi:peptidoglycan DL-endopeptidase CwlO